MDKPIKKSKKVSDTHAVISVHKDVAEALNKIRGSFSYGLIIKYLLIKCRYLTADAETMKEFRAMDRYFTCEDK